MCVCVCVCVCGGDGFSVGLSPNLETWHYLQINSIIWVNCRTPIWCGGKPSHTSLMTRKIRSEVLWVFCVKNKGASRERKTGRKSLIFPPWEGKSCWATQPWFPDANFIKYPFTQAYWRREFTMRKKLLLNCRKSKKTSSISVLSFEVHRRPGMASHPSLENWLYGL